MQINSLRPSLGLFSFYDHIVVVLQGQVAQVIYKIIGSSFFGSVEVGKIFKIESLI
jgi:hypothetical protein